MMRRMPWLSPLWNPLGGHYWTLRPFASRHYLARRFPWAALPEARALALPQRWRGQVDDERWGALSLSGLLHVPPGAKSVLLNLHGLGGNSQSAYIEPGVWAAAALGWACLRLNMRGADGSGEDFYHAALTADLHAALASPELSGFEHIYVLGHSLGGHLALRLASEAHDPRVRAVAAVCSPLDLARSAWAIDQPRRWPYRHYVLQRLKAAYVPVAARRALATPLARVLRVRSLREWDELTVVPRFGFASGPDYYERASAAGRLHALAVPALLVNTEHDPMVPAETVRPALLGAASQLDVRWLRTGGHVGFPLSIDLGEKAPRELLPQVVSWLANAPR
jgi:predicted alpha/beta-fold hydrolase